MSRKERWADSPFFPGDLVVDQDNPWDEGVVVALPNKNADEWNVPGRGRLSEDNPEYPEDDDVVCILFGDTLDEEFPYYSGVKPLSLSNLSKEGVKFYSFLGKRLRKVGEIEPHDVPLSKVLPSPAGIVGARYERRMFRSRRFSHHPTTLEHSMSTKKFA